MKIRRPRFSSVLVIVFTLAIFSCGALTTFRFALLERNEMRRVEALEMADAAALSSAQVGEDLLVFGSLDKNPELTQDGLVAFERQIWDIDEDSDGDASAEWEDQEVVFTALTIRSRGVSFKVERSEPVRLDGAYHTTIVKEGAGSLVYDGIREGTLRHAGFRNGDRVTVLGKKSTADTVLADHLYGGTPEELADELRSTANFLTLFGIGFMGISSLLAGLMVWKGRREGGFRLWLQ